MSSIETVDSKIIERKIYSLIEKQLDILKTQDRGCGLSPHIINSLCKVLDIMIIPCFECKVCNTNFPKKFLSLFDGNMLCVSCKHRIQNEKGFR